MRRILCVFQRHALRRVLVLVRLSGLRRREAHVPYLSIAGVEIPTYGLMVALGILASIAYLKVACKRAGLSYTQEADAELALICGVVGCVVGAKLLR